MAVKPVTHANLHLVEAVEHIELRERDAVDAGGPDSLPEKTGVEPAAAPRAPRDRPEFTAALAEPPARLVVKFGRKRPLPYAGRVSLRNPEHIIDRTWPHPPSRSRPAPKPCWMM